jgi:hypothetical protein
VKKGGSAEHTKDSDMCAGWVRNTCNVYILSGKNTVVDTENIYLFITIISGEYL